MGSNRRKVLHCLECKPLPLYIYGVRFKSPIKRARKDKGPSAYTDGPFHIQAVTVVSLPSHATCLHGFAGASTAILQQTKCAIATFACTVHQRPARRVFLERRAGED